MKMTRIVFAVAVLTASFASAFALRSTPAIDYGYIDGSACVEAPACSGSARDCKQFLDGQQRDIRIWNNATSCGSIQSMQ